MPLESAKTVASTRLLLACCLILAALVAGRPGPARAEGGPFGMGVYLVRVMGDYDLRDRVADLAAASGAGWTREEFNWAAIEPQRGVYDQDLLIAYDRMEDLARANGGKTLGLIAYNNPWSSVDQAPSTAEQFQDYADFVSFLVRRYQGRIQHWEIWNEPNNPRFWQPRRDPLQYTLLLKYAYQAAKAADPQAQVAGCAVVGDDVSFITDVLMAGGGDYLDAVSLHPYPQPKPLEWSQEAFNIKLLKDIMPQMGLNKPIWITETGYSTYSGSLGVSRQRQAQLLARAYLTALALGVEVTMWYDFRDDGTDAGQLEQNFGLVTHQDQGPGLENKPAYDAFRALTGQLSGASFQAAYLLDQDVLGLLFNRPDGSRTLAVWTVDEAGQALDSRVNINIQGRAVAAVDVYGRPREFSQDGGTLSIVISGAPVYISGGAAPAGYPETSLALRP